MFKRGDLVRMVEPSTVQVAHGLPVGSVGYVETVEADEGFVCVKWLALRSVEPVFGWRLEKVHVQDQ